MAPNLKPSALPSEISPEVDDMGAIGVSGLRQYGGWIDEEFHPRLRGRRGVQVYREMADNDAIVGAILYVISTHIRQVKWWVDPRDEKNPAAVQEAAWLEDVIVDMSHTWEDLIDEALSMLVYGWAYFEIVYKLREQDKRYGWRKIELRGQDTLERWEFDLEDVGLRGMWQAADSITGLRSPAFIPIEKALLFRPSKFKNNPEGKSILRPAMRSWWMLKRIQEIEAIGVERDLTGLPVFEVPAEILSKNAGPKEREIRMVLETLVQQIRRDEREGMLIPASERTAPDGSTFKTGYKFSLVTSGGRRQMDTNAIITRYEQRIAMSVLAEFIMLGMQEVGSRSLASSKTDVFAMSLGALLGSISSVLNRYAVPRLMQLNQVPKDLWPKLAHGDIESPPLEEVGAYITSLANAGFALTTNKPLERKLFDLANLPAPPVDEELP